MYLDETYSQAFRDDLSTSQHRSLRRSLVDAKSIGILIIDDHVVIRTALRMFLESQPGLTVVGEVSHPKDALAIALHEHPDIILLDLDLGDANGLDMLPQLHTAAPEAHVLVLTGVRDVEMHSRAVRLGAVGIVRKERAAEVLLEAIAKVHAGEVWLDSLLLASVLRMTPRPQTDRSPDPEEIKIKALTARERELIEVLGKGLKNQAIADHLCISEATVRHHLTSIYAKLNVEDRLELAIYAYRHGLVSLLPHRPKN
jgi:two-component system, NarL family, nitrate/nitrite response regulator NarL